MTTLSSKDQIKALSDKHGIPGIDLQQVVVPLENLQLVPQEIARRHRILPVLVKDDRIFLAMVDPADRRVIDEIEFVTGRRVFPYIALPDHLDKVVDLAYRMAERNEGHYVGSDVPADYLASLGLDPGSARRADRLSEKAPAPSLRFSPTAAPPPRRIAVSDGSEDDLGIAALEARRSVRPQVGELSTGEPFHSQVAPMPTAPKKERPANPKVLIVDDEQDIRKLLHRVMSQKGYTVVEAAKGLEALQKVRDEQPDVILLDAMLPEVHGFDICRRIKGSQKYGHIPIIMVSAIYRGWRVAEDLKQSYGVSAFLEKPFKIGDVLMHVERALEGRSAEPAESSRAEETQPHIEDAMAAYHGGDLDKAIEKLREGLAVDPLSFQLHYHLGLLCGRRDDVFEAIHELEAAVDLQPRNFSALKNLAVLYQRAGFKHKAVEMWERALSTAPDDETRANIKEHLMELL